MSDISLHDWQMSDGASLGFRWRPSVEKLQNFGRKILNNCLYALANLEDTISGRKARREVREVILREAAMRRIARASAKAERERVAVEQSITAIQSGISNLFGAIEKAYAVRFPGNHKLNQAVLGAMIDFEETVYKNVDEVVLSYALAACSPERLKQMQIVPDVEKLLRERAQDKAGNIKANIFFEAVAKTIETSANYNAGDVRLAASEMIILSAVLCEHVTNELDKYGRRKYKGNSTLDKSALHALMVDMARDFLESPPKFGEGMPQDLRQQPLIMHPVILDGLAKN